jgi:hypothetical protein
MRGWTDDEEEGEVRLANLCHIDEKEEGGAEICECFYFRVLGEKRCFFVFYVCG